MEYVFQELYFLYQVLKRGLRKISVIKEFDFKWLKICVEIASKIKEVGKENV